MPQAKCVVCETSGANREHLVKRAHFFLGTIFVVSPKLGMFPKSIAGNGPGARA
jgi:hypothetical protein